MANTNITTKVDLLTGFLGAGKTTFIRKYCDYLRARGVSFAVIENEYGKAGVDAAVLRESGIETDELSGGCICCTLKVGFHDMLLALAEKGIERIIVEPSGIYEAAQFFSVMGGELLRGKCEVGSVLCIVDPTQLGVYDSAETGFLAHQLRLSGGIILSRTQLMEAEAVKRAGEKLRAIAPDTPILFSADWDTLTDSDFSVFMSAGAHTERLVPSDTDHSKLFQSCTVAPRRYYSAPEAEAILEKLMDGSCGEILRVKGFVPSKSGLVCVNAVPGLVRAEAHGGGETPAVNIIGLRLDRKKIKALWEL